MPYKGFYCAQGRLPIKIMLISISIILFLISDICPYYIFIKSNCWYKIASCSEMLSTKVSLSTFKVFRNFYCALTFQVANCTRYWIFWRDTDAHMDMIWHQMPFQYFAAFPSGKFIKNLPKKPSEVPIYHLPSFLGNKNNMVLTIPTGISQTLVISHRFIRPFSWSKAEG